MFEDSKTISFGGEENISCHRKEGKKYQSQYFTIKSGSLVTPSINTSIGRAGKRNEPQQQLFIQEKHSSEKEKEILRLQNKMARLQNKVASMQKKVLELQKKM